MDLAALAQRVYSSPWHLARTFRELTGMSLHRYQLRARMAAALDEVLDSRRDLTTIGIALGFSSHSHFTACFRRNFGVTPSELRRRAHGPQIRKILTACGGRAPKLGGMHLYAIHRAGKRAQPSCPTQLAAHYWQIRFERVLEGRAIQDVWILRRATPNVGRSERWGPFDNQYGMTLRVATTRSSTPTG